LLNALLPFRCTCPEANPDLLAAAQLGFRTEPVVYMAAMLPATLGVKLISALADRFLAHAGINAGVGRW